MARLKHDVRLSVWVRGQRTVKIELIRQPSGRRFWIRRDGRKSLKLSDGTLTEVLAAVRRWIGTVRYDPRRLADQ